VVGVRILIAGTRSFGAAVLEELDFDGPAGHSVHVVVAPPGDRLARAAANRGIRVEHTVTPELIEDHAIDLIVGAHSHTYIGRRSRQAATYGAIGYHPSLLPRHRGKDAVRWTIKMGDPIAGGSVYWFTDNIDAGPIARQAWVHVLPGWDHHDLWERLFPIGVRLLRETVVEIASGVLRQVPQDEAAATWEPSWERPPVHRPELIELGSGINGARVVATHA
jgi:methionyl-tRNA formyltransferase